MTCRDSLLPAAALRQDRLSLRRRPWRCFLALLHCWRDRAEQRRNLAQMGSRMVWRDLGLSDAELRREVNKPFWRR
jgi:uncharacterized protein YjiS (DUF1127 family)